MQISSNRFRLRYSHTNKKRWIYNLYKEENPDEFTKSIEARRRTQGDARAKYTEQRGWEYRRTTADEIDIQKAIGLIKLAIDYNCPIIFLDRDIIRKIRLVMNSSFQEGALDRKYKAALDRGFLNPQPNHDDHFHIRFAPLKKLNPRGAGSGNREYINNWNTVDKLKKYMSEQDDQTQDDFEYPVPANQSETLPYEKEEEVTKPPVALTGDIPYEANDASGNFTRSCCSYKRAGCRYWYQEIF